MINLLNTAMTSFCQVSIYISVAMLPRIFIFREKTREKILTVEKIKSFLILAIWKMPNFCPNTVYFPTEIFRPEIFSSPFSFSYWKCSILIYIVQKARNIK